MHDLVVVRTADAVLVVPKGRSHPALEVESLAAWPDGPRTNYEIKYEREGRSIRRLVARLRPEVPLVHPTGLESLAVAHRGGADDDPAEAADAGGAG